MSFFPYLVPFLLRLELSSFLPFPRFISVFIPLGRLADPYVSSFRASCFFTPSLLSSVFFFYFTLFTIRLLATCFLQVVLLGYSRREFFLVFFPYSDILDVFPFAIIPFFVLSIAWFLLDDFPADLAMGLRACF